MAYTAGAMGLREATSEAVKSLLVSKLPLLIAALNRDTDTSFLLTPLPTADFLLIGDRLASWDIATGFFRMTVSGANTSQSVMERMFIDTSSMRGLHIRLNTSVYIYFHPDAFKGSNNERQVRVIEKALNRVEDWLSFGVLNNGENLDLQLTSQCYNGGANFDFLTLCELSNITKGHWQRAFDNMTMLGIHGMHTGQIA